ncbi:MAG: Rrf2 family transcriptional regulator [Anaerolineales bacterium]|nr:Rrf2 family transcriptional regulator [Anaerolineales bacterium]MCX7607827.1 Rrf2 family transcriptional regulator [Anaerolineales bacterium]MDW8227651.1 Rrf2 family transcriptional regulator [Anaerolineales bacterium]
MFRVNRQTDYAIRVVLALAKQPPGTRLSSADIGKEMLIPAAFLSRIVAQLAQAQVVQTFPGRDGGLQLARPPEEISLREIVDLMEGPLLLSECMLGEQACPFEHRCPVRTRWQRLQAVILEELEKTKFSHLAQEANAIHSNPLLATIISQS